MICGMDEAGRGPLAGPLVAVAVVMPADLQIEAVDSKAVAEKRRFLLAETLKQQVEYHAEIISVEEIDMHGIGWANCEVFRRLIDKIEAETYIVDGNLKLKHLGEKASRTRCLVKADRDVPVVSAASILAKCIRDEIMLELHERYPVYHWNKNKGYGTQEHIRALKTFGSTPHHRRQFVQTVQNKSYAHQLYLLPSGD